MLTRAWLWWAASYGLPRTVIYRQARRADPLARFLLESERGNETDGFIEEIRDQGPLLRRRLLSVTVNHRLSTAILRDKRFSAVVPPRDARSKPVQWLLRQTDLGIPNPVEPPAMVRVDPPDHTRYRRLVVKPFNHRAIEKLREQIVAEVEELLAGLAASPAPDLMENFSAQLPVAIIGAVLGAPKETHPNLLKWGIGGAPLLDLCPAWKPFRTAVQGLREGAEYFEEHINHLRREPGDNVLSHLIANGGLNQRELLTNTALLLGAGFETTVNLLGNGIVLLQNHPEQLELLRAEPERWPGAIEEILRFDSPVQVTARVAMEDLEVEGHEFGKGAVVMMLLGGANHDPDVFPDPYRFDVTRPNARDHLSFGNGIHTCLGANLARLEGQIALRSLYDRFSEIKLDSTPVRRGTINLHGWQSLPATLIP
ncbi:cytochrome P450 [Nocardia sp. NPDC051570]|uniref:cytochrome P450 n=1 Tax=Nocardia sp. NPDC051570 TaxID=3364324 RepID=UPI0037B49139